MQASARESFLLSSGLWNSQQSCCLGFLQWRQGYCAGTGTNTLLFNRFPSCCYFILKGRTFQQRVDVIACCISHILLLLHDIKVQAAFLFGWLMFNSRSIMNLQALITTPLPSQFLAILYLWPLLCLCMYNCLILFWKNFTSLAGFCTILLVCPYRYLSRFLVCAFHLIFSPIWPFVHTSSPFPGMHCSFALGNSSSSFCTLFSGWSFPWWSVTLLTGFSVWIAWCHWPFQRPGGPALQPWTYRGPWFLSKGPIKDQGRSFFLF